MTHRISVTDLRPDLPTSIKYLMMVRHFLASPLGLEAVGRDVLNGLYTEYKRHLRREGEMRQLAADAAEPVDQLSEDLRAIGPQLRMQGDTITLGKHTLIEAGEVVRGAQSRVGEALGIPNAGQANRERIFDVLETLQKAVYNG